MTISVVQSGAGATGDSVTSVSVAFAGNVTAGNLVVVGYGSWRPGNDAIVAGDITKSAGTATLGAFTLHASTNYNHTGSDYLGALVASAIVTGTGSCTIQVAGAPSGSYVWIAVDEYSATGGWDASRQEATNTGQAATGAQTTGNMTSAGGAIFVAASATNTASLTTHTPDAAFTTSYASEDGANHVTGELIRRIVTTGTTDAGEWTAPTTVQWTAAGVALKEVAAAGGTVITPLTLPPMLAAQWGRR